MPSADYADKPLTGRRVAASAGCLFRGESLKHLHRAFFKANQESVVFIASSSSSPLIYLTKRIRESESGDEKPFPV
jgi:hypothetical protein